MELFSKIKQKKKEERELLIKNEKERLLSLNEKELMIEMILKLTEVSYKCDDIMRKIKLHSN